MNALDQRWGEPPVPPDPSTGPLRGRALRAGRTAIGAVPRFENGWASRPWGFDSLSFRSRVRPARTPPGARGSKEAWLSWKSSALLPRRRRRPLAGSNPAASASFRRGRVGETRDCYSRGAGSSPAAGASTPPWSNGDDAGVSSRLGVACDAVGGCSGSAAAAVHHRRVRVPPGVSAGRGGVWNPAGFGNRRAQVRFLPARLAR
jgi:hypothetical protein